MSYYSRFDLIRPCPVPDEVSQWLKQQEYPLCDLWDGFQAPAKWYECKDEMLALSIRFPTVRFRLDRYGEEQGDVERMYFRNGKVAVIAPHVVWPAPPDWFPAGGEQ